MKKFVLLAAFLAFCTLGVMAQNTGGYIITGLKTYDRAKLTTALDKCRFDNYRKMDQRVTLTFTDGSTVELLSVKEMQHQGLACDVTIVTPAAHQQNNIFALHPDGYIVEEVRKDRNSSDYKRQVLQDQKNGKP